MAFQLGTLSTSLRCLLRPTAGPGLISREVFSGQVRNASIIGSLRDAPGSRTTTVRKGRGPSSGKGKTSGRGHKGQKQHGKVPAGFNGGQTPLFIVHGERGFVNRFSINMTPLNLDRLQSWIDQGKIDASKPITMKELVDSRCLHGIKDGVKLLGDGAENFTAKIDIVVSRASTTAIEAIEKAGGKVTTRFFNKLGVLATVYPQHYPPNMKIPEASSRKEREYYRNPAHRGYLAHTLKENEAPSLYFKEMRARVENPEAIKKKQLAEANRLF